MFMCGLVLMPEIHDNGMIIEYACTDFMFFCSPSMLVQVRDGWVVDWGDKCDVRTLTFMKSYNHSRLVKFCLLSESC